MKLSYGLRTNRSFFAKKSSKKGFFDKLETFVTLNTFVLVLIFSTYFKFRQTEQKNSILSDTCF